LAGHVDAIIADKDIGLEEKLKAKKIFVDLWRSIAEVSS
jgi:hypothetical protein